MPVRFSDWLIAYCGSGSEFSDRFRISFESPHEKTKSTCKQNKTMHLNKIKYNKLLVVEVVVDQGTWLSLDRAFTTRILFRESDNWRKWWWGLVERYFQEERVLLRHVATQSVTRSSVKTRNDDFLTVSMTTTDIHQFTHYTWKSRISQKMPTSCPEGAPIVWPVTDNDVKESRSTPIYLLRYHHQSSLITHSKHHIPRMTWYYTCLF